MYSHTWAGEGPGGDGLPLHARATRRCRRPAAGRATSGPLYLYARAAARAAKVEKAEPFARHAVFLLDTTLSEHPDRFDVSMKLLQGDPRSATRHQALQRPDLQRRRRLGRAEGLAAEHAGGPRQGAGAARRHRAGRGDRPVGGAGEAGSTPASPSPTGTPLERASCCPTASSPGARRTSAPLVARFEQALPVPDAVPLLPHRPGRGERGAVRRADARRRRHLPVLRRGRRGRGRRTAHRQPVPAGREGPLRRRPAVSEVLVAGRKAAVYPGGELIVAAQRRPGRARRKLVVEGTFLRQEVRPGVPRRGRPATASWPPRGWGEVAVASLLALNDPRLDEPGDGLLSGVRHRQPGGVVPGAGERGRLQALQPRGGARQDGSTATWAASSTTPGRRWARRRRPRRRFGRFLTQIDGRVKVLERRNGAHVAQAAGAAERRGLRAARRRRSPARCSRKGDVPPAYLDAREHGPPRRRTPT